MAAVYPGSIKNFGADVVDLVDTVYAAHVNDLRNEVTAIETELGTGLKNSTWTGSWASTASWASLAARLINIERGIVDDSHTHYVKKAGDSMSGVLTMGSNKISNLADGTVAADAATYGQVLLRSGANAATGSLPMGSNKITGLAAATTAGDALRWEQVLASSTTLISGLFSATNPVINGTASPGASAQPARSDHVHPTDTTRLATAGGTMSGAIAMGSNKITGLANGTASADAVNKGQLDAAVATKYCIGVRTSSSGMTPGIGWNATFQSETDPYGMLNTSTGTVTIPDDGVWMITGFVEFNSMTNGAEYILGIVINSVSQDYVQDHYSVGTGSIRPLVVSGMHSLTAGATVNLNAAVTTGTLTCSSARLAVVRVA